MKSDPVLDQLFSRLSSGTVDAKLRPIVVLAESKLIAHAEWPQAWEPLQPELFGSDLPDSIKSFWLFVLRAGQVFGAERHPNSHQRSIALKGSALFEVFVDGVWSGCPIDSAVGAKTISIPAYLASHQDWPHSFHKPFISYSTCKRSYRGNSHQQ